MPFCPECGTKTNISDKFCGKCGKNLKEQVSDSETNKAKSDQKQTTYEGTIHKCPVCGEIIAPYSVKCSSCGNEFRDVSNTNSVREFSDKLLELNKRPSKGFFNYMKREPSDVDKQKIELIKSFPIPNTKEDILDFLILANSNISPDVYTRNQTVDGYTSHIEIANAWLSKYEQALQKAQILINDSNELRVIETHYQEKCQKIQLAKRKSFIKAAVFWTVILFLDFGLPLIIIFGLHNH